MHTMMQTDHGRSLAMKRIRAAVKPPIAGGLLKGRIVAATAEHCDVWTSELVLFRRSDVFEVRKTKPDALPAQQEAA